MKYILTQEEFEDMVPFKEYEAMRNNLYDDIRILENDKQKLHKKIESLNDVIEKLKKEK